jgi:hypothetical protein
MLKRFFTSKVRIKLLQVFLSNPNEEYFIRELTRKLDEQINSVRRELDNLKKTGLLTSKTKNRKKYYVVNKNFIILNELKQIFDKAENSNVNFIEKIEKLGKIDLLVLSGVFVNKESTADLLIIGEVDKEKLANLLEKEVNKAVKFSVLSREDFLYRIKLNDQFILNIIKNPDNIISINRLEKYLES